MQRTISRLKEDCLSKSQEEGLGVGLDHCRSRETRRVTTVASRLDGDHLGWPMIVMGAAEVTLTKPGFMRNLFSICGHNIGKGKDL